MEGFSYGGVFLWRGFLMEGFPYGGLDKGGSTVACSQDGHGVHSDGAYLDEREPECDSVPSVELDS